MTKPKLNGKRGRPSKGGPETMTVATRVPTGTWEQIHVIAKREDRTVAYVAAKLLNSAVEALQKSQGLQ